MSPFWVLIFARPSIIKQICIDLQKQTNCPEEDLKDFLEFISKQWNK